MFDVQALTDDQVGKACRNILRYGLRAKPGERLLLVFDQEKEHIAEAFVREADRQGVVPHRLRFPTLDRGMGLPTWMEAEVRTARSSGLLVVLMSPAMLQAAGMERWGELVGFPSRPPTNLDTRIFADWVLPGESFSRVYSVDWLETARYRDALLRELSGVKSITVSTVMGTEVSLEPRGWVGVQSGGSFGSISEVFTAPVEESFNGVVIYDASLYYGKPRKPIRLRAEQGRIVEVGGPEGDEQLGMFLGDMRRDDGASVIAELGLGLNPGADPFGHVMEAERARGTCHFDFGYNVSFGGMNRSAAHFGGVCHKPTLHGDGRSILQRGFLPL